MTRHRFFKTIVGAIAGTGAAAAGLLMGGQTESHTEYVVQLKLDDTAFKAQVAELTRTLRQNTPEQFRRHDIPLVVSSSPMRCEGGKW